MFTYILKNIGLNIFEIDGFTKNDSKYVYPGPILGCNSSWNILEVKGSYYIIFPSIYFCHITIEEITDFYFCSKSEHFIWTYIPKYPKWQLLEKSLSIIEFQNKVFLYCFNFFYYFNSIFPESNLNVEKRCSIKIYKKNQNNKILCKIMGLQSKKNEFKRTDSYLENLNCKCMAIDKEDYKEIKCIFNKRVKYRFVINGNDSSSNLYSRIAESKFNAITT